MVGNEVNKIEIQEVLVTPDVATAWINKNTNNRNLRDRVVKKYASDMRNGNWNWTGDPLRFSSDGRLLDGQHRLAAVIESKVSINFLVIFNLPDNAQEYIDQGTPRGLNDVLRFKGYSNVTNLGAALRKIHSWEQGYRNTVLQTGSISTSNSELLVFLEKTPMIQEILPEAQRIYDHIKIPQSVWSLAVWVLYNTDSTDAKYFFDRLVDGVNLSRRNPIYVLRETLQRQVVDNKNKVGNRTSQIYQLVYIIKAWNAFRDGREIDQLRYAPGGAKPEDFPTPI